MGRSKANVTILNIRVNASSVELVGSRPRMKRLVLPEARGPERTRHRVSSVQVADGDLQIDDVLRAESRHARGADVVDASRGRADQLADACGDPLELLHPSRLIGHHHDRTVQWSSKRWV